MDILWWLRYYFILAILILYNCGLEEAIEMEWHRLGAQNIVQASPFITRVFHNQHFSEFPGHYVPHFPRFGGEQREIGRLLKSPQHNRRIVLRQLSDLLHINNLHPKLLVLISG